MRITSDGNICELITHNTVNKKVYNWTIDMVRKIQERNKMPNQMFLQSCKQEEEDETLDLDLDLDLVNDPSIVVKSEPRSTDIPHCWLLLSISG